jgi:hypothetical protein
MRVPGSNADTLTATGYNTFGKALLYLDTEHSPDDFWHAIDRARRRARLERTPPWLSAHCLTDLPTQIGKKALKLKMAQLAKQFGGIFAVIIDGVADLCLDVNDAAEANELVAYLHELAIAFDCPILAVLHRNPGSTSKTRGHLGSQLERKSETNLSLDKDDKVTVVWSDKQRRAPIERKNGPRFAWDDGLGMHVTVAKPTSELAGHKERELVDLAMEVLAGHPGLRYTQLVEAIQAARNLSVPTAKRRVAAMRQEELLSVDSEGIHSLRTPPKAP